MGSSSALEELYKNKDTDYYGLERSEILAFLPDGVRSVLDIGCGEGAFGGLVKEERKCEVWGIEPTDAATKASDILDRVISGDLVSALGELEERTFDVICFNDVLEHMPDPHEALRLVKPYLSEKGCVIASIPNILFFPVMKELLFEQDFRYKDFGVLDNTHLRFFTKKSMSRMFEACGYSVDQAVGINQINSKKFRLVNFLLLGRLHDWKFTQFVIVARPR